MKRLLIAITASLILSVSTVYAQTKKYALNIGDFTELTVNANVNVVYKAMPDSAGYAIYTCSPKVAHAITFNCLKNKVKIEVYSDEPILEDLPTITVYSTMLTKAVNQGDSTITLANTPPCEKLGVKVIGNGAIKAFDAYVTKLSANVEAGCGRIFVSGKAKEADLNVAGAGAIEAGALQAQKVKTWMLGTGTIDCSAEESLTLYGAGSGTVYYKGEPKIKERKLGPKLVKID